LTRKDSQNSYMKDKKANPQNYAMITISEGAKLTGGAMVLSGESDAYGHRRLGGIGEETGAILKELTGEDVLNQRLSYLMRSGTPDSLDQMAAVNYANTAIDLFLKGVFGRPCSSKPWNLYRYPPQHYYDRPEKGGCERTL